MRTTIALLMMIVLAACARQNALETPGVIQLSEEFVSDFDLVDHNGATATDERFKGRPLFIYYGFATCPDVCPASLSVMSASLEAMGSKADKIQPLFVTVDPERDTPAFLKSHLAFDDRILGLTGTLEQMDHAAEGLKVFYTKVDQPDSALGYTMQHSDLFYVVDAEGQAQIALQTSMLPKDIAAVLSEFIN